MRRSALLLLNTALLAVAAALLLWWPLVSHYRVAPPAVDAAVIERHRLVPADAVLNAVASAAVMSDQPLSGSAAVAAARRILQGELALPHLPVLPIELDFAAADLERGVPVQQLYIASLLVPDLLLRAYELEPDPAFLAAARRYLRGFIAHEAGAALPRGLLRNAHAVVNRVAILTRFWKLVRADSDPRTAAEVHLHAARLGALLAKPSLFIAATNHGVMQNLALLQLAAAFPALPEAAAQRQLALARLQKQLPFYVGPEGAVLEHSAGYHFHGVVLTGFIARVLQASGEPVPSGLLTARGSTLAFLAELQRPDRTLPPVGNTHRYFWSLPPLLGVDEAAWERQLARRDSFAHLFPVSGHAVWWDRSSAAGVSTQTVVPWGYFPGHGHQRAQEMSLLIWAAGTDWSSNTGYWPGDDAAGVEVSNGWDGGNAPHVVGEPADDMRRTTLLGHAAREGLRVLDLERIVPGGPRLRRQILQWQGATWLVLDSYADAAARPLRVLWTAAPETQLSVSGARRFDIGRAGGPVALSIAVGGSENVTATPLRGSRSPFGGWVAFDRRAAPAPSVDARLTMPGGAMLATLRLAPLGSASLEGATLTRYAGPQDWEIRTPRAEGTLLIVRRGQTLRLGDTEVALHPGPDVSAQQAAITAAGDAVRAEFPRVRTFETERLRASLALGLWWLVLLPVPLLARRRGPMMRRAAWLGVNGLWLAAALWLAAVYVAG